jgi:CRP-like cAMP-binding protein
MDDDLLGVPLFEAADVDKIRNLESRLTRLSLGAGEVLMRQGDESQFFAIVVDGAMRVVRESEDGESREDVVSAPTVMGELAMLTGRRRTATVAASSPATVLTGGPDEFQALLEMPGTQERLQSVVSGRLAENARSVATELPDGTPLVLHPLRASDREEFIAAYENLSLTSLQNRFISGGRPPRRLIEYLLEVDYVNHFAWLVAEPSHPERGIAEARYVRLGSEPDTADVAFMVTDAYQGRGIGTLLMGALAAAASAAGVDWFTADVRGENAPMLALLNRVGASRAVYDHGVVTRRVSVADAAAAIPEPLHRQLQGVASDLITGVHWD